MMFKFGRVVNIEKVQRRAARWVTNQHDSMSSVTAMLQELDWQPLELRRAHSRLGFLPNYKWYCGHTTHSLSPPPTVMLLVHHDMRTHCNMRHTNAGHTILQSCYSKYFPHTVVLWNALPQVVVSSPTLQAFKTSLRRCRMPQICTSDNVRGDIVITL